MSVDEGGFGALKTIRDLPLHYRQEQSEEVGRTCHDGLSWKKHFGE